MDEGPIRLEPNKANSMDMGQPKTRFGSAPDKPTHQQQQQQQQHHHQQYDDSPGDVHGNKRKAEDGSQGASSKSRRSRYISLAW